MGSLTISIWILLNISPLSSSNKAAYLTVIPNVIHVLLVLSFGLARVLLHMTIAKPASTFILFLFVNGRRRSPCLLYRCQGFEDRGR